MKDRVVVVTGAGNGIGAALAERLAARGCRLVLVDRDERGLSDVSSSLAIGEDRLVAVAADVSSEDEVNGFVTKTIETFGRIDGLVNNAAIEGRQAPLEELTVDDLNAVYSVNILGVFLGIKAALPHMKTQGSGAIVNTASLGALWGLPDLAAYIMSKHAVVGLTRVAAAEGAPAGVRVNAVLPGATNTGMMRRIEAEMEDPEAARVAFAEDSPMSRFGEPTEIAAVFEFLLSPDASFVTSSLYTVDGGAIWQ